MDNVRHLHDRDTAAEGGRVPPHDLNAEASVLGAMLLDSGIIGDVAAVMDPADHYRPAHEVIHRAILDRHTRGLPVDPITLTAHLAKTGDLQRAGGQTYVARLPDAVLVASAAPDHAVIVRDLARRRRLIEAATRIVNSAHADGDVDQLVDLARKELDTADSGTAGPAHLAESILQWDAFFATDFGAVELLPGRLLAPGQQIAIVGDGKAGKSLFSLEWLWRMAAGLPFLGDRAHPPVPVLYLDAENGRQEVQSRLISLGATPATMGLLTYASFPPVRPLDTPGGGADLMAMVTASGAQVVALDTVSRFISGEENSADTWLALYRCALLPLKRAGIASVRLDHFGKDKDRGGRGSSAKTQDVDHVWELSAQGGSILGLKRTYTRTGVGPDHFGIFRQARQEYGRWLPGETRHVLAIDAPMDATGTPGSASTGTGLAAIPGTVEYIVAALDRANVPSDWGSPRVIKACADLHIKAAKSKIEEAVRIRRNRVPADLPPHLPYSPVTYGDQDPGGPPEETPGQTSPGEVPGTSPTGSPHATSPRPPSQEGGGGGNPGSGEAVPLCLICRQPLDPERIAGGYDTHHPCP